MRVLKQKQYWLDHFHDPKYEEIRTKILNEFKDLVFYEEPHKYFVGERELECVSNVTHVFKKPFNTEERAFYTSRKYYNNPDSPYYHKTPEEVQSMWIENSKNACTLGTERHAFAESCFYFMTGQYDSILPEFKDRMKTNDDGTVEFVAVMPKEEAVVRVYEDFPDIMIPILAETKVYNVTEEYAYAGTFDILFYLENPNGRSGLYVLDWKTNKDLYKSYGDKLLPPFDELDQCDVNVYKLQLSLYHLALKRIGLNVLRRELFWLKPNGNYEKVKLEDYSDVIDEALKAKNIK